jgi:hypothetical protein
MKKVLTLDESVPTSNCSGRFSSARAVAASAISKSPVIRLKSIGRRLSIEKLAVSLSKATHRRQHARREAKNR